MRWCFDTSAFIEPWVRRYPPDVFPRVWAALDQMVGEGKIIAPTDVKQEIEHQDDGLSDWTRAHPEIFLPPDRQVIECLADVVNQHPGLIKPNSTESGADPFVIALAEVMGVPVVTYETMAARTRPPKIPNVCLARGLQCVDLVHVLRSEGFALG